MAPATAAATAAALELDPGVWRAIAGTHVRIPRVGDRVYYFPQGHAEQAASLPNLGALRSRRSFHAAVVTAVSYLANADTDEVFVRFDLDPGGVAAGDAAGAASTRTFGFAKILTPSDATSGGGFSVPRYCAESIFPRLDLKDEPPSQNIQFTDVHGTPWRFRHIYRGTPKRHLLTSNWAKFVANKSLIAGDSVVFVRDHAGQLFIGLRRTGRFCSNNEFSAGTGGAKDEEYYGGVRNGGFSRSVRGRIPAGEVVEAMRLAEMGKPFEVAYYPKAGYPEYVLEAGAVEAAMRASWVPGLRVNMSMETEDSSRLTSFQGTIASIGLHDSGPWARSPWRMIQVTWDEPEVLRSIKNVNPWQLQVVPDIPPSESPLYPSNKKIKVSQNAELFGDGEGNPILPGFGLNASMMESFKALNSSIFNYSVSPAGMQGARHDQICVSAISNYIPQNIHHDMYGGSMHHELPSVSTELNIWNSSQSGSFSSLSQGSSHNLELELLGSGGDKPAKKVTGGSIQLFGQIIHIEKPDNAYSSTESEGKEGAMKLSHKLPLPYQTKMITSLVQYHKVQTIEAFSL